MKRNYGSTGTMDLENSKAPKPGGMDTEEMMREARAAAKPGPEHQLLGNLVGDWQAEVKCWMEPGGSPEVSAATAKGTWIMNGLFLQEDFDGEMMGQPFHGRTILGYDQVLHTFKVVWLCDTQTSIFVAEGGSEDGDNKVITLEGTGSCPVRGEVRTQLVFRILSPDRHSLEMFDLTKGEHTKSMEINYVRA